MEQINKYFNAEKGESVLFVFIGVIAILIAIYFFTKLKLPFYCGMAYPFIIVAFIQITVGTSIYFRSPRDIFKVSQMVQNHKSKIQLQEIPRMETVMKNFALYKKIEIALIVAGLFMYFFFKPATFWKGVGLGLFIQAGFMLLLDFFAESRGTTYIEYLKSII